MVDFSDLNIKELAIHFVGNKTKDEDLILSKDTSKDLDSTMTEYLLSYFLTKFKFDYFYEFIHETDIDLNEIYSYTTKIFEDKENFLNQSINIAKHLYEKSVHPNIKKGELYIVYFSDCLTDGKKIDAIGIFKSENKEPYLNVKIDNDRIQFSINKGININKLDKGCLIFNTKSYDNNYKISIIDMNSTESMYWKKLFLNVKQINSEFNKTSDIISAFKKAIKNDDSKINSEKMTLLNNTINYFQKNDYFDMEELAKDVLKEPEFEKKVLNYLSKEDIDIKQDKVENFKISESAVNKEKKKLRNFIKLDDSIEIQIKKPVESINNLVEKGYDEIKKMNYYKIFYTNEN